MINVIMAINHNSIDPSIYVIKTYDVYECRLVLYNMHVCSLHNAVWFWRVLFSVLLYGDWTFNIHNNVYYGRMHVADGANNEYNNKTKTLNMYGAVKNPNRG